MRKVALLKIFICFLLVIPLVGTVSAATTTGNSNTGSGSTNNSTNNTTNTNTTTNSNNANVNTNLNINANTGGNNANNNTGNGTVNSGGINVNATVTNCLNANGAPLPNCPAAKTTPAPGGGGPGGYAQASYGGGYSQGSYGGGYSQGSYSGGTSGTGPGGEVLGASTLPATGPAVEFWTMIEASFFTMILGLFLARQSYGMELNLVRSSKDTNPV